MYRSPLALTFQQGEVSPHYFTHTFITTKIFNRWSHFSTIASLVGLGELWSSNKGEPRRSEDSRSSEKEEACLKLFKSYRENHKKGSSFFFIYSRFFTLSKYDNEDRTPSRRNTLEESKDANTKIYMTSKGIEEIEILFLFINVDEESVKIFIWRIGGHSVWFEVYLFCDIKQYHIILTSFMRARNKNKWVYKRFNIYWNCS